MKILAVADEESPALWDYYRPGCLDEYDLIIACGDMKASYLTFLATMAKCRVLYIHGNHDAGYDENPPQGCDVIDDHLVEFNGIRILGLGGCLRYRKAAYQYTEAQMRRRIARLTPALLRSKGVDIVAAHAPLHGIGDLDDPAHQGFRAFYKLLDRWHPQYFIHGHVHLRYDHRLQRIQEYNRTRIINASGQYVLEIPDRVVYMEERAELKYLTRYREGFDWDSWLTQE